MQRQQKLLLSVMVGGLVLFYGMTAAVDLTSQEIADIALGSTVRLDFIDVKSNSWTGSGFVIYDDKVATNYHVVENMLIGYAKLVRKSDKYYIEVLTVDKDRDLAVIKVAGIDAPALPLGDSDAVQIGDKVYVAGNPRGLEGTFSAGIISAIRPEGTPLVRGKTLQMDASISPGSSGGPVLNDRGEVIGISVGHRVGGQNLNFAIPVNYLKRLANIPITPTPVKPKPVKPKVDPPPAEPKPAKPQVEPPPVESKPVKPQVDPSSVQPKPAKPKVDPPPAEPKPTKPQVEPPPVEPKPVKPQVDPSSVQPKPVKPQVDPPKLEPPKPRPRHDMLEKGIKLYEQARYNEAIEALSSAVRELEDPEQQAEAYIYLGGSKRGSGEGNDKVKEQFQEAIRHNPDQKLPTRIGKDHPIFAEWLEEGRKELTGELTVISLLPHTEIWIDGNGIDKKMLGTGIVSRRLLEGAYIVEGIYTGGFKRRAVTIEPNRHKELDLEIPPIVKHDSPSRISVGEIIPLTLNLISSKSPQQIRIYYKTYDRDRNELEQNDQEMRLWDQQSASSTWAYKMGLPSQKRIGSIEYYIEVEYDNRLTFRQPAIQYRHYQISIFDNKPPTIDLLNPPESAQFIVNQQTTVRAEVIDNSFVKEVRIYFLSPIDQSQKLFRGGSLGVYAIDITFSRSGSIEYYLTATDEAGNESQSESRHIDIRLEADPQELEEESQAIVELPDKRGAPTEPGTPEKPHQESTPSSTTVKPSSPMSRTYPIYQGIWASISVGNSSNSDWDGGNAFRLAYLREGKTRPTLGAQLNFSPNRTNTSAIAQWGPALGKNNIGFTLLGGIAEYENFFARGTAARSTHTTPILGAGLTLYPRDKIAIDATSSIKFRSDFDTTHLYHYEIGARFHITRKLNMRVGYGKLYLGSRNVTTMQIGLGFAF